MGKWSGGQRHKALPQVDHLPLYPLDPVAEKVLGGVWDVTSRPQEQIAENYIGEDDDQKTREECEPGKVDGDENNAEHSDAGLGEAEDKGDVEFSLWGKLVALSHLSLKLWIKEVFFVVTGNHIVV